MYLSAALQDTLICLEMPIFAVAHAFAFSYHDYVQPPEKLAGRMPFLYAMRDSFDVGDIVADTIATFHGTEYTYRLVEPNDSTMHHAYAFERRSRAGLRYTEQGKGKYWVQGAPNAPNESHFVPGRVSSPVPVQGSNEQTPLMQGKPPATQYTAIQVPDEGAESIHFDGPSEDEQRSYDMARKLPFGDYRYPCIGP